LRETCWESWALKDSRLFRKEIENISKEVFGYEDIPYPNPLGGAGGSPKGDSSPFGGAP
jgi:hypothetical protein